MKTDTPIYTDTQNTVAIKNNALFINYRMVNLWDPIEDFLKKHSHTAMTDFIKAIKIKMKQT